MNKCKLEKAKRAGIKTKLFLRTYDQNGSYNIDLSNPCKVRLTRHNICLLEGKWPLGKDNKKLYDKYSHYRIGTDPVYVIETNGDFNTRIDFPYEIGKEDQITHVGFCEMNRFTRFRVKWILGNTFYHTNPVAFIALIISFVSGLFAALNILTENWISWFH